MKKISLLIVVAFCMVVSAFAVADQQNNANFCIGNIQNIPQGLSEIEDPQLLKMALGEPGKGGLCMGKVYLVDQPVTVYRVWNSQKSYTLYGRWWSFEQPQGSREEYRQENAICPSWSSLDMMSRCELKVGAKIVVGPGQSAQCQAMTLPKSATNQVFVNNDSRNNVLWVKDCSAGNSWPEMKNAGN